MGKVGGGVAFFVGLESDCSCYRKSNFLTQLFDYRQMPTKKAMNIQQYVMYFHLSVFQNLISKKRIYQMLIK